VDGQKGSAFFSCFGVATCSPGKHRRSSGAGGVDPHARAEAALVRDVARPRRRSRDADRFSPTSPAVSPTARSRPRASSAGSTPAALSSACRTATASRRAGWTLGAGLEGRLWGNWTGKVEYLYVDLGSVSNTVINTPALVGAAYSSRITDNIFRRGVNYHFYQPVVARY
jgi:outer membrane immunogenic protein